MIFLNVQTIQQIQEIINGDLNATTAQIIEFDRADLAVPLMDRIKERVTTYFFNDSSLAALSDCIEVIAVMLSRRRDHEPINIHLGEKELTYLPIIKGIFRDNNAPKDKYIFMNLDGKLLSHSKEPEQKIKDPIAQILSKMPETLSPQPSHNLIPPSPTEFGLDELGADLGDLPSDLLEAVVKSVQQANDTMADTVKNIERAVSLSAPSPVQAKSTKKETLPTSLGADGDFKIYSPVGKNSVRRDPQGQTEFTVRSVAKDSQTAVVGDLVDLNKSNKQTSVREDNHDKSQNIQANVVDPKDYERILSPKRSKLIPVENEKHPLADDKDVDDLPVGPSKAGHLPAAVENAVFYAPSFFAKPAAVTTKKMSSEEQAQLLAKLNQRSTKTAPKGLIRILREMRDEERAKAKLKPVTNDEVMPHIFKGV